MIVVGAGNVANSIHIPAFRKISDVNITGICDINEEMAEKTAKKWGIPRVYTDFDDAIDDMDGGIIWVHSFPGWRFGETLIHPYITASNGDLNIRDVYTAKRGGYEWVEYDELYATFDADDSYANLKVSFNSPRWSVPYSLRSMGRNP